MPRWAISARCTAHQVADRDQREAQAVGAAGGGVDRRGPGRPHAAAQQVGADHEEAVGVERPARADDVVPPAAAVGIAVIAGGVGVAGERVAHEDRVGALGVERPVGLVRHLDRGERRAGVERQRPVRGEQDGAFRLNPSKRWPHGAPQRSEAPAGCQPPLSSRPMEDGIATTRLDDYSPERFVGLRRALGVTSFGMNQMRAAPRPARADPRARAPGGGLPRPGGQAHGRDRGRRPRPRAPAS